MRSICDMRDLNEYGIRALTGEADSLGYRVLCDLTEKGRDIVAEALGVTGFPENWNSGAVASFMLAPETVHQIAVIALIKYGCHTVFDTDKGTVFGLCSGEAMEWSTWEWEEETDTLKCLTPDFLVIDGNRQKWPSCYGKINRKFTFGSGPHVNTRNVHAMSGRSL